MAISTKYNPAEVEDKWYDYWMNNGFFHSTPDPAKQPYTIVIPPPNVTGVLHMGHMLNNTIQDILVRKARMEGKEACWVPGTDHASIATEARVVAMLREKGIKKSDLSREEFLTYAWEWKEKYGGIILEQLKKLGASCDWDRTKFTMDPDYYEAVIDVFIDLHKKGLIYRGNRMVNWDPLGKTALSDDEVIHKEVNSKLYYINYLIDGEPGFITIATTRPETILADAAVCVHPEDERYFHLKGKRVLIPLLNKSIPIIEDEYVTREFGTGCLKVTPAHDMNDYELGKKHHLESIDILNDDGSLNSNAKLYVGKDRFAVRKEIAKDLEAAGQLAKVEDYKSNVGYSERTDAVIEPRLSMQWFLEMKAIAQPALKNVMDDTIQLIPAKFKNTYHHWLSNVRDWCISRQLWWGHRIPAWYAPDGSLAVARTAEEAFGILKEKDPSLKPGNLKQDEDVLDTWFSSWLWPMAVFDTTIFKDSKNNKGNKDLNYYYPTNDLVTAPEILFLWVARMITAGYEYRGQQPFKNVYLTGIVRDKQGRKMSKSLGNSPDALELIANYGADAVRTGMLFSSPAGNDLLYDEKLVEQGRNFTNKIWNAFRLIKGWSVEDIPVPIENKIGISWFAARLDQTGAELQDHFNKFRISDALHTTYKLMWDDFCAWYLEIIKPEFGKPIDRETYSKTITFFEALLKLLHPFMPFISEELWHELAERKEKDCIMIAPWPSFGSYDNKITDGAETAFEVITQIRNLRNARGLSPKESLALLIKKQSAQSIQIFEPVIQKLANLKNIETVDTFPSNGSALMVKSFELFVLLDGKIDTKKEVEGLLKELEYARGFLASVNKKLQNEKFVKGAPAEVIDTERLKKSDAETKIKSLEETLKNLEG